MTNTEVTDGSVTAVAQYYQLLSDATLTNTEVTDENPFGLKWKSFFSSGSLIFPLSNQ